MWLEYKEEFGGWQKELTGRVTPTPSTAFQTFPGILFRLPQWDVSLSLGAKSASARVFLWHG